MAKMIFVNLPVADVARATAFYEAIGMRREGRFSTTEVSAMRWTETIGFMLLSHAHYATFTAKPIADTRASSAVLLALSCDSRGEVDAITGAAIAAGGRELHGPEDAGFMYSRAFEDLDGHSFGPMWMDPAAIAGMPDPAAPVPA